MDPSSTAQARTLETAERLLEAAAQRVQDGARLRTGATSFDLQFTFKLMYASSGERGLAKRVLPLEIKFRPSSWREKFATGARNLAACNTLHKICLCAARFSPSPWSFEHCKHMSIKLYNSWRSSPPLFKSVQGTGVDCVCGMRKINDRSFCFKMWASEGVQACECSPAVYT